MVQETILRSEVLRQLDTGEPFASLEFVTADRKRGTGGELVEVKNWCKKTNGINEARPGQKTAGKLLGYRGTIKVVNVHNPFNKIAHPIGVHVLLIQTFNGKRVING